MSNPHRVLLAGCAIEETALCRDVCSDLDCRVESVMAGAELLEQLPRLQPHLVLLDTTLEKPDAYDLCRRIKSDTIALVLMLTTLHNLDDINRAVDAGTDDFICKPINKNSLRKRVESMLKLYEALY